MDVRAESVVGQILDLGYATTTLSSSECDVLNAAFSAAEQFFALPLEVKSRYVTTDLNHGYRPVGHEYSASADRPDLNECFVVWHDRVDLIPGGVETKEILETWAQYRDLVASIAGSVVTNLARRFGAESSLAFHTASYLQMNGYTDPANPRDLLQDLHEDGHLITVHYANAPGLEARANDQMQPLGVGTDALLIMPGSVLTELTSGRINPLYHQVRNLHITGRGALMYFVNPSLDAPVYSWRDSETQQVDLREKIRSNPAMFGLVDVPEL